MTSQQVLLAFLYFILILVILPTFCSDKIYSMHYQEDRELNDDVDKIKSEYRKRAVLEYMLQLNPEDSLSFHNSKLKEKLDNVVIVIAKKPANEDDLALSQLVTELDNNIRSERHHKNALIVCNATRIAFGELNTLAKFYPVKQAENTTSWKLFNKEEIIKHDFIDCLDLGVNRTSTSYITLIRDVVVPYSGFLNTLNHVISSQISGTMKRGDIQQRDSSWLFLHLQEPVIFRHFAFTLSSFRELLIITLSGSLTFYLVFRLIDKQYQPSSSICTHIFFGALYFLTFALVIGRPYITELRRSAGALHRVYDPPEPVHFSAMAMPVASINELVEQLNRIHCSAYVPFHEVMDHMVNTLEKPGFVISPSLVRYVTKV